MDSSSERVRGSILRDGWALEGVISQPGERFHAQYANPDFTRSGHVDGYAVRAGAVLSLPRP